jgi:hypothetical protein
VRREAVIGVYSGPREVAERVCAVLQALGVEARLAGESGAWAAMAPDGGRLVLVPAAALARHRRRIVDAIARVTQGATPEVTPAPAPEGRGSEARPAAPGETGA